MKRCLSSESVEVTYLELRILEIKKPTLWEKVCAWVRGEPAPQPKMVIKKRSKYERWTHSPILQRRRQSPREGPEAL
jgi:hypothetical protein